MSRLVIVALLLATGCSKTKLTECEDLQKTVEKVAKCDKVPAEQRKQMEESAKMMKDTLEMIEKAGEAADEHQVTQVRDMCRTQNKLIVEQLTKTTPECVK